MVDTSAVRYDTKRLHSWGSQMRSYRIDLFGPTTPTPKLRLFGPDGSSIGQREYVATAATPFVTEVAGDYAAVAPNLQAIGRKKGNAE